MGAARARQPRTCTVAAAPHRSLAAAATSWCVCGPGPVSGGPCFFGGGVIVAIHLNDEHAGGTRKGPSHAKATWPPFTANESWDCSREPLCAISEHGGVHGHCADFTEPLRRGPSHAQGLRRPSPHFDGPVRVTEWRECPTCCVARGGARCGHPHTARSEGELHVTVVDRPCPSFVHASPTSHPRRGPALEPGRCRCLPSFDAVSIVAMLTCVAAGRWGDLGGSGQFLPRLAMCAATPRHLRWSGCSRFPRRRQPPFFCARHRRACCRPPPFGGRSVLRRQGTQEKIKLGRP